jgi:RNA polymerase sigma-70 factor (ECF subfamily)
LDLNRLHDRACQGDKSAEDRLFEHLTVSFRLLARRKVRTEEDSEEVVQEALKAIAEAFRTVELKKSFAAWAHSILHHKIVDYVRARRPREDQHTQGAQAGRWCASASLDPAFEVRLLDCLRKVARANMRYARLLNLHHQGYTTAEICERFELTTTNFYVTLSRARNMLAACLDSGVVA